MRRVVSLALLVFTFPFAWANDPNEVVRSPEVLKKVLSPNTKQVSALKVVDAKFGGLLTKLRAKSPSDYVIQRDALNEKYTRQFMAVLSPIQKSNYKKLIRSLRQGYIEDHPEVDADNNFIWGGANLL